ncbi:MAG: cation:proton antiporter [Synergistales bacterium]|nr:cation:proton antiporter [Synergistales bacterium]
MNGLLILGVIVLVGYGLGWAACAAGLPRITGYIVAGILLNPSLLHIIPQGFVDHTDLVVNIMLCFITFSVGGTLGWEKLRKQGKSILTITLCEAEFAFLLVVVGFSAIFILFGQIFGIHGAGPAVGFALLLGSLASPTDPSASLAVSHEYHAKGEVSSTILGVAAFDDALGIINYSIAVSLVEELFAGATAGSPVMLVIDPLITIFLSLVLGVAFGVLLHLLSAFEVARKHLGLFIVVLLGTLTACFGCASVLKADELLSTMVMGAVVTNISSHSRQLFALVEDYLEDLVFVLFFTVSCMHLDLGALASGLVLIPIFIVLRTAGKFTGVFAGAKLAGADEKVKRFTAFGLIPQGGIVVGLALLMRQHHLLGDLGPVILSVVIGATIIHELAGPLLAKLTLEKAGEINTKR